MGRDLARRGAIRPIGSFIKGLIKLAAAGVKVREGRLEGVRSHAQRAAELFSHVADQLRPEKSSYFGLSLPRLIELAAEVVRDPPTSMHRLDAPVEIVFPFVLWPDYSLRSGPAAKRRRYLSRLAKPTERHWSSGCITAASQQKGS